MFRQLLPRCSAALPAAAATFAVPGVAPSAPAPPQRKPASQVRRAVACEEAGTVAIQVVGGLDAFHGLYELGEELGRGTFGVVQRACHKLTGRQFAVKRVQQHSGESTALVEAGILASLNHPNIVGFQECYRTDQEVVLVQELCEGVPLEAKLGSALGTGLDVAEVAAALRQMLVAVRHCHECGYVHRDLKLDNFVFVSEAPDAELKLIDFGLASRCGRGERLQEQAGSVDFSSPEALRRDFGHPADIWALGAIFFLLITGEPLIRSDHPAQTPSEELCRPSLLAMRRLLDSQYTRNRLAAVAPRLPEGAVDLLSQMLQPDPKLRITAERALHHKFISEHSSRLHKTTDE